MMIISCVFLQKGQTALHLAASKNHVGIVNILLMQDSTLIKLTDSVSEYCIIGIHIHEFE